MGTQVGEPGVQAPLENRPAARELVDAVESGWFPKDQRVIDMGCGNGEVSRWLADQGLTVLGLITVQRHQNCRRLSAGQPNAPAFEFADLCQKNLRLEPAFSLIDRGCFHRIVGKLRSIFAQNIARITVKDGHFLLIAGTFQDPRVVHYGDLRSIDSFGNTSKRFSVTTLPSSEPKRL